MKQKVFTTSKLALLLILFFSYELVAIKFNFFSLSFELLSIITLKKISTVYYDKEHQNIIKSIIYNNPLYNSEITKHLYSVKIIGISPVIYYSGDFFYIQTIDNIKPFDIVANDKNFLGIVEKVSPNLSKVRYIDSINFQLPAKVVNNIYNLNVLGFIKRTSKIEFFSMDQADKLKLLVHSYVQTKGYYNIPSGIPIGILYNNEVILYKTIHQTEQVIVIRKN